MRTHEVADFAVPKKCPAEVVSGDHDFSRSDKAASADIGRQHLVADRAHERDIDPFSIRGRRAATVEWVNRLQWRIEDDLLPDRLTGMPVEAEKHAFLLVEEAGREEYLITPNDRRRMADARNSDLPG